MFFFHFCSIAGTLRKIFDYLKGLFYEIFIVKMHIDRKEHRSYQRSQGRAANGFAERGDMTGIRLGRHTVSMAQFWYILACSVL